MQKSVKVAAILIFVILRKMSEPGFIGLKDNMEMKYADITEKVIRCAMKVHNTLGNGFTHKIINLKRSS